MVESLSQKADKPRPAHVVDLGVMEYRACWALQKELASRRRAGKILDTLLLVEHPPVLTLGARFDPQHLLLSKEEYARRGIDVVETDRGGDVTYHGPRQLVMYPLFDVKDLVGDLHQWLRGLEEVIIRLVERFGLRGYRFPPFTGVWVNGKKIAAIGVKVARWINLHGIALNCNNDLSPFRLIVPCGIRGYEVTSISRELGREVTVETAKCEAILAFADVFSLGIEKVPLDMMLGE